MSIYKRVRHLLGSSYCLHPLLDRVQAIKEAPEPTSMSTLKAYLGMLTYYSKVLPNLSTFTLLSVKKGGPLGWGITQAKAFNAALNIWGMTYSLWLITQTYPSLWCIQLWAGSGPAVLSHRMPNRGVRPIEYASCTLSSSEQNYSQLEKEWLSCIFRIKKFPHDYLFNSGEAHYNCHYNEQIT